MTVPHRPPPGTANSNPVWPRSLERVAAVRFARRSNQFESTVQFYRDLVGLPVHETFTDSYSSDGVIFGLPDASLTFEIVRSDLPVQVEPGEQLCLYFRGPAAMDAIPRAARWSSRRSSTEPTSEVPFADRCVSRSGPYPDDAVLLPSHHAEPRYAAQLLVGRVDRAGYLLEQRVFHPPRSRPTR